MEPTSPSPEQPFLDDLRRHRAELRESLGALEEALAAPAAADRRRWGARVQAALAEVSGDFAQHQAITEGPEGLYQDLLRTSPRLAGAVAALTREHEVIGGQVEGLLARVAPEGAGDPDVDRVRDLGLALLGRLARHRQRGSDLVFEAYEFDIGGET